MPKYRTYYGRKKNRWIKAAVILLLLAGVAAFGVYISDYVTFSDGGISIDLPFLAGMGRSSPSPSPSPEPEDYDGGVSIETPSPPPSEEPSAPPTPEDPDQVFALFLPMSVLGNEAALTEIRDKALADGANMLALEYKNAGGAIADPSVVEGALALLRESGLTLTAVVTAGVDNTIPRSGPNTHWGLKVGGVNFVDGSLQTGNRWLNLYMPEVREYIVSLVADAYDAGFDRVMLTHVGFPHTRGAGRINYNGQDVAVGPVAAVGTLISELRQTAGSRPLDVWLFEETYNEGVFEAAGQDLEAFSQIFDLMFVALPADVVSIEKPIIPILPADGTDVADKIELSKQGFMLYSAQGNYH